MTIMFWIGVMAIVFGVFHYVWSNMPERQDWMSDAEIVPAD